ncbi:PREDICTED: snaclec agkisacutacin subunit B-like [Cyprinodon variegatus]|uniref:Snaclec agkisacutacin subunit B-like n=1 Tax=Cyprinodon variegatus TaxID=28743 RepID=A0A3Q2E7X5_CYPVA|nr:PREDICTED: snaclec agkisacutacin subunit B-like [Cyprinodon variegatus]
MLFFLLGVSLGAVSPSANQVMKLECGSCPMFWYSFNGRCYKYVATRMSWADAEFHCLSEKANLVSIHSQNEQKFVKNLIKNFDPAQGVTWIGLSDLHKEGRWMWSDMGLWQDMLFGLQENPTMIMEMGTVCIPALVLRRNGTIVRALGFIPLFVLPVYHYVIDLTQKRRLRWFLLSMCPSSVLTSKDLGPASWSTVAFLFHPS